MKPAEFTGQKELLIAMTVETVLKYLIITALSSIIVLVKNTFPSLKNNYLANSSLKINYLAISIVFVEKC